MAYLEPRFSGKSQATGTMGMMSTLVKIAESRGVVSVEWAQMNPTIWLLENDAAFHAPEMGAETALPTLAVSEVPSAHTGESMPAAEHQVVSAVAGPQPLSSTVADVDSAQLNDHRSRAMGEVLKEHLRDPLSDARLFLYNAINQIIRDGQVLSVPDLLGQGIKLAESLAVAAGKKPGQPWGKLYRLFERELIRLGLALDQEGKPVSFPTWESTPLSFSRSCSTCQTSRGKTSRI
jgi:hypothetical protein